ncbi:MAG: type II toxin-antitoxin system HipA family toxin [Bdellovibrio sp.]
MEKGKVFYKNAQCGDIQKKADGSFEFQYGATNVSVSLTLPASHPIYKSETLFPFFDGLIPEGWLLNLAEKNWKIPRDDRMTLLLTTCQDCIGAAHIHREDQQGFQEVIPTNNLHHKTHSFSTGTCLICMETLNNQENLYHSKCAKRLFGFSHAPIVDISIQDLEKLALLQINQRLTLTGVQKKLSLSPIIENKKERLTVVGFDGRFILKPSTEDFPEMAELEHLCMKMAEKQGIPTALCGLVYLSEGERAYITRRFDRIQHEKIQVEDLCQLSEKSTSQKYTGSSEGLGKVIDKYSDQPQDDKLTLFQLLLFSFWIGNADMHLKNFSLWRDPRSSLIRMSPAYDILSTRLLIPSDQDKEEMALPINGRKNKLKWSDFQVLSDHFKIPRKVVERVRDKMLDTFFESEDLIQKSFLSDKKKEEFVDLLIERSKRLSQ